MSKFGNLSGGGGGAETDTGAEAGSSSDEGDDVLTSMDAECTVCMQESKVSQHQVAYSVDDLYCDYSLYSLRCCLRQVRCSWSTPRTRVGHLLCEGRMPFCGPMRVLVVDEGLSVLCRQESANLLCVSITRRRGIPKLLSRHRFPSTFLCCPREREIYEIKWGRGKSMTGQTKVGRGKPVTFISLQLIWTKCAPHALICKLVLGAFKKE
jgi:hypothetical protein